MRPPGLDETCIGFDSSDERTRPTDARREEEPSRVWSLTQATSERARRMRAGKRSRPGCGFWKTASQLTCVAQPNGSRLSCGAERERSQIKDYHNEPGRRQLQALVRLPGHESNRHRLFMESTSLRQRLATRAQYFQVTPSPSGVWLSTPISTSHR